MKKWLTAIISLLVVIGGSVYYAQSLQHSQIPHPSLSHTLEHKEIIGYPVTLTIPRYNVTAKIESVGLDSKKRMDIPKNFNNVAWYNLGFKPGEKGSAVIDGHVDTPTGAPAVFANISRLNAGDEIKIQDSNDRMYIFVVKKVTAYPYDQLPMQAIFNTTDRPRLNLITCAGTWDKINKNYSERTVVYAEIE